MLALSSRPWLGYSDMGRYNLTPLSYEALDHCSSFSSEQCPEGFCAVAKNTLRILSLERLGESFNQQVWFSVLWFFVVSPLLVPEFLPTVPTPITFRGLNLPGA